jgi:hypothetical protein
MINLYLISIFERKACAGYFVYSFQNQEVCRHAGNLKATYLVRRLQRKSAVIANMNTLFWNGYAK